MRKYTGIIATYLTVAVLLVTAVLSFPSENNVIMPSDYSDGRECLTSLKENAEFYQDEKQDSVKPLSDEETASENNAFLSEVNHSSSLSQEAEGEISTDADFSQAGSINLQLPQYYTYVPDGSNETVGSLNFFSENFGKLDNENSINVYTFTLDSCGVFRYTFVHNEVTDGSGWNAELYQEYSVDGISDEKAYRLINVLTTTAENTLSSPELGLIGGNYRLVVSSGMKFNAEMYKISVSFEEGVKYEKECNDNIYRYTELYCDVPIKGSASKLPDRQDEDYYMFRMYSDGFVELDFSHKAIKDLFSVCWQIIFYSEDMKEIFSVNSVFNDGEYHSGRIGLEKGNYYIAVKNRVYTDMTYTLNVRRTAIEDFERERNDTTETADNIYINSTVSGTVSSQISGLDIDYFRLELAEKGTLMLELAHNPIPDSEEKPGWNFSLTDINGRCLYSGVSMWDDDVCASPLLGLPSGTYFIKIDSNGIYHSTERYYLTPYFTACEDYETEYNDRLEAADEITEETKINAILADRGSDYDYDFFVLELPSQSDVKIDFCHEKLSYSKEIFVFTLLNESGNAVKDINNSEKISILSDEESVTAEYSELPAGKYYIKVSSGIFFDNIEYSLNYKKEIKES